MVRRRSRPLVGYDGNLPNTLPTNVKQGGTSSPIITTLSSKRKSMVSPMWKGKGDIDFLRSDINAVQIPRDQRCMGREGPRPNNMSPEHSCKRAGRSVSVGGTPEQRSGSLALRLCWSWKDNRRQDFGGEIRCPRSVSSYLLLFLSEHPESASHHPNARLSTVNFYPSVKASYISSIQRRPLYHGEGI